MKLNVLTLVSLSCFAFSCSSSDDEHAGPTIDCASVTVPKYSEVQVFQTNCIACHNSALDGAGRQGAPTGVNFDTYEAAKTSATLAQHEVFEGAMPPNGTVPQVQQDELYAWVQCGMPN